MTTEHRNRRWIRWIGLIISLGALGFVIHQFQLQSGGAALQGLTKTQWLLVLLLGGLYAMASMLLALAWWCILAHASLRVSLPWSIVTYGLSQLAKYLPGNVFHFAGRQALAMSSGLSGKRVLLSTGLELLLLVLAGTGISLIFLTYVGWSDLQALFAALAFMVLVGLTLLIKGARLLIPAYLLQMAFLLISGGLFYAAMSMLDLRGFVGLELLMLLCTAHVAAWLVGLVVPGAPAGLGVREAVLLLLLEGQLPPDLLLAGLALARLINLLGDLIFFMASSCFRTIDVGP